MIAYCLSGDYQLDVIAFGLDERKYGDKKNPPFGNQISAHV